MPDDIPADDTSALGTCLATAVRETHDAVTITDAQGRILSVNAAFSRMTGYSADQVIGRTPDLLESGRHGAEFHRAVRESLERDDCWEGEVHMRHRDGRTYPAWERIIAVRSRDGNVTHYVAVQSDLPRLRELEQTSRHLAAEERALGSLLRISLVPTRMREYLENAVEVLLSAVPWLELLPGGAVFLNEGGSLRLVARSRLHPTLQVLCARVPIGKCLCGRAAQRREIQHAQCVDTRHEIRFDGMQPHGHYNVPILRGEDLLGVLVLYLPHGRERSAREVAFLERVADALGMGISARQTIQQRMDEIAHHNPLTGLPNRARLCERIQDSASKPAGQRDLGALLHLGLDRFSIINHALGNAAGDRALRRVADRLGAALERQVSEPHFLSHLGADEFAVWLPHVGDDRSAVSSRTHAIASTLQEATAEQASPDETQHFLTASIGITLFRTLSADAEAILKQAGAALHHAKEAGRNTITFHQPDIQAQAEQRVKLEHGILRALEAREFILHYQPQVDGDGRLLGAEALIRWSRPGEGLVSPAQFIPVAEDSELIVPIGRWALGEACRQLALWSASTGDIAPDVAVNVSAIEFHRADYTSDVARVLAAFEIDPHHVTLELTEGIVMRDPEDVVKKMGELRAMGVRLSLDDFGTGYSSLSYLRRLPIQELKIDQSFVRSLPDSTEDAALVETIVAMAERLGFETVAEGVETQAQRDFLSQLGCDRLQGFLFDRPLVPEEFTERWIGGWRHQARQYDTPLLQGTARER